MGLYINPQGQSTEDFLQEHGIIVQEPTWPPGTGYLWIFWVDNGPFAAAAIAYNEKEFDYFMKEEKRVCITFLFPVEKVWGNIKPVEEDQLKEWISR